MKNKATSSSDQKFKRDHKKLKYTIKTVIEQIMQVIAYPKTVITFGISMIQNNFNDEVQIFGACVNACIILMNQAGLNQKQAPFAAFTMQLKKSGELEFENFDEEGSLYDVVCDQDCGILHFETVKECHTNQNVFDVLMTDQAQSKISEHAQKII